MKKTKYILYLLGVITFTSCNDKEGFDNNTLEPFPKGEVIAVDASLSTATQTRAVGKTFEANDKLLAYVEAGKMEDQTFTPVVTENSSVNHALYSKLLTFIISADTDTKKNNLPTDNTDITKSEYFEQTYYWDDFSTMDYDLRDAGRGIRLKYGYCYNGGTPTSNYDSNYDDADKHIKNGQLEWTVNSDQKTNGTKSSDLLMATTQDMITYNHSDVSARGTLVMPFTHAMSQFTIEIQCGPTFDQPATALTNTEIDLHHVQAKCTVDAPNNTVNPTDKDADGAILPTLNMHPENAATNIKRFTAIVAPTNLTVGNILANINAVAGIPYQIDITDRLLTNAPTGKQNWLSQLDNDVEDIQEGIAQARPQTRAGITIERGKGYRTKPGVNYKLVVTVNKQKIDVYATIADWVEVDATANGTINFEHDITTDFGSTSLGDYTWFDVFRAKEADPSNPTAPANYTFDENTATTDKINEATTYSKNGTTWSNTPDIYWPNATDRYYFRALGSSLAKNVVYADASPLVTTSATSGSDYITIQNGATNNNDMIWGTTEAHNGTDAEGTAYNYAEGAAIAPRTGDVPLTFKHILSKVSFKLQTTDDAAAVNLDGAKIQITNINNVCHLNLNNGETSTTGDKGNLYADNSDSKGRATTYNSTDQVAILSNQIVTPQTIGNEAILIITLADGTTYKVQLNQCDATDSNGDPISGSKIGEWKQGEHYTYTIHLSKEAITFRALIKDWEEKSGSGNATLEWD